MYILVRVGWLSVASGLDLVGWDSGNGDVENAKFFILLSFNGILDTLIMFKASHQHYTF